MKVTEKIRLLPANIRHRALLIVFTQVFANIKVSNDYACYLWKLVQGAYPDAFDIFDERDTQMLHWLAEQADGWIAPDENGELCFVPMSHWVQEVAAYDRLNGDHTLRQYIAQQPELSRESVDTALRVLYKGLACMPL